VPTREIRISNLDAAIDQGMTMADKPDGKRWGYLVLRVVSVVTFCAYLAYDWSRAPNASILLGPLWFVYEIHSLNLAICTVAGALFMAIISPTLKPCALTGCMSAVASGLWLFAGMVGEGMEC
jgi:hypothetical protein